MKILNAETLTTPIVGMDATYSIGGDSYGGKIIAVSPTGHRCTWQRDNSRFVREFTRRRDGTYFSLSSRHGYLTLGVAETNLDRSF